MPLRRPPLSMMPWQTTHFSVSLFRNPRICQRIKCSAMRQGPVLRSWTALWALRISPAQGSLFKCHRQSAPRDERTRHLRLRMIADLERCVGCHHGRNGRTRSRSTTPGSAHSVRNGPLRTRRHRWESSRGDSTSTYDAWSFRARGTLHATTRRRSSARSTCAGQVEDRSVFDPPSEPLKQGRYTAEAI